MLVLSDLAVSGRNMTSSINSNPLASVLTACGLVLLLLGLIFSASAKPSQVHGQIRPAMDAHEPAAGPTSEPPPKRHPHDVKIESLFEKACLLPEQLHEAWDRVRGAVSDKVATSGHNQRGAARLMMAGPGPSFKVTS